MNSIGFDHRFPNTWLAEVSWRFSALWPSSLHGTACGDDGGHDEVTPLATPLSSYWRLVWLLLPSQTLWPLPNQTLGPTLTLAPSYTHTHTFTPSYAHSHTLNLLHSHAHTATYTHTLLYPHSYTLIHSQPHTYTLIHSHTHALMLKPHTLTLIHTPSYSLTPSYTHTLIHPHTPTPVYTHPHTLLYSHTHTFVERSGDLICVNHVGTISNLASDWLNGMSNMLLSPIQSPQIFPGAWWGSGSRGLVWLRACLKPLLMLTQTHSPRILLGYYCLSNRPCPQAITANQIRQSKFRPRCLERWFRNIVNENMSNYFGFYRFGLSLVFHHYRTEGFETRLVEVLS